jgi:hypothetical protein
MNARLAVAPGDRWIPVALAPPPRLNFPSLVAIPRRKRRVFRANGQLFARKAHHQNVDLRGEPAQQVIFLQLRLAWFAFFERGPCGSFTRGTPVNGLAMMTGG